MCEKKICSSVLCAETGTGKTNIFSECISGNNDRLTGILAGNKTTEPSNIVLVTDGLELLKKIIVQGNDSLIEM